MCQRAPENILTSEELGDKCRTLHVCGIVQPRWSGRVVRIRNKEDVQNFDGEVSSEILISKTRKALGREVGCEDRRWMELREVLDQAQTFEPSGYSAVL
jgi:hypothetical protein